MNRWGYTNDTRSEITYGYTDADGNWHLPYICQLSTLVNLLSQRKGVFFFASHCTPTEIGIEAYSDQASCDAAKSYYESKGYTGLSVQPAEGLWMLCVDEEFVHQHFHADLVFDMGCYADARRCDFWQSAATIHYVTTNYLDGASEEQSALEEYVPFLDYHFPPEVSEEWVAAYPDYRHTLWDAWLQAGVPLTIDGDTEMVLGPTLIPFHSLRVQVDQSSSIATLNLPLNVSCTGNISGSTDHNSVAAVSSVAASGTNLQVQLFIAGSGNCTLTLSTAMHMNALHSETGGIVFNGRQDTELPLAVDTDPLAAVEAFQVRDGSARIVVCSTRRTAALLVEGAEQVSGPYRLLARIGDVRPGLVERPVPAVPFYRLREVETDGDTLCLAVTSAWQAEDGGPAKGRSVPSLLAAKRISRPTRPALSAATSGHRLAILAPPLFAEGAAYYADLWGRHGVPARVFGTERFWGSTASPDTFRTRERAVVDSLVAAGYDAFLLIGDASDAQEITSPWPAAFGWEEQRQALLAGGYVPQPEKNLHPAPVRWYQPLIGPDDGINTPYYFSDWLLLDCDGDGWPDPGLVVGRLPFTTEQQLEQYLYKLEWLLTGGLPDQPLQAAVLTGDVSHFGDLDGPHAADVMSDHVSRLPADWSYVTMNESAYPDEFDRALELSRMWNTEDWNFVVAVASLSSRYKAANFFDTAFSLDAATPRPTHYPFLLLNSCGTADYWWTEQQGYRPVAEYLLAHVHGAIGLFGPGEGSWQESNRVLGDAFLDELRAHPHQGWGTTAARAVAACRERSWWDRENALRAVLLGDPLVEPLAYNPDPPVATGAGREGAAVSLTVSPNPCNPLTEVAFTLPAPAGVTVRLYDLRGRRVRTLLAGRREAGRYRLRWDGRDDRGRTLPGGAYLCRLRVESGAGVEAILTRKLLLVR